MTAPELLAALDLPVSTRVQQRVPKKLLLENGAPTAADKRVINDGIEEIQWLAVLKPANIGVLPYRDAAREYLEIAVLQVTFREDAKVSRLIELIHRAIPYPALLLATQGTETGISLAHKRWSQNEVGKVVLDDEPLVVSVVDAPAGIHRDFLEALPLAAQPRSSLFALYQSWLDDLIALQAALQTGSFRLLGSDTARDARRAALLESSELREQLVSLRVAAKKASQMARQVELNLQIKELERKLAHVRDDL
jgi:hypothetical protein